MGISYNDLSETDEYNDVVVDIAPDKMSARVMLHKPLEDKNYSINDVIEKIHDAGITYTLDMDVLNNIVHNHIYDNYFVVANGKPAVNGEDGEYTYFFNKQANNKPTIKEDGTVDYYNIQNFTQVSAEQIIASYKPETPGIEGYNVCGEVIKAIPGKRLKPLRGRYVKVSEDGCTYYATKNGKIELKTSGEITIEDIYEITGDVDLSTGNISFAGDVKIQGNILPGMQVTAKGNIYIAGRVENASIISDKDIVVNQGIISRDNLKISCAGSLTAKYIENSVIEAGMNVTAGYILNCEVYCKGTINVSGGKKASIIGGTVSAVMGIETVNCGSEGGVTTNIRVGCNKQIKAEYARIQLKLKELMQQLDQLETSIDKYNSLKSSGKNIDEAIGTKMLQSKIILKSQKSKLDELAIKMFELMRRSKVAGIKIDGNIYQGTKIFIDELFFEPNADFCHVLIRKYNNEIIIRDY